MHTIMLEDFGVFLGKKSMRFIVKKKGETLGEFPANEVERIIVSSQGASMSSSALYLAVENRIPVSFTYSSGRPFAFLTPTMGHGTVVTRRAQYLESDSEIATTIACGFILGKIQNQRSLVVNWGKNRTRSNLGLSIRLSEIGNLINVSTEEIRSLSGRMTSAIRQEIFSIEARAAINYWDGVSLIVPDHFGFKGRVTRHAKDPFNMMLNYGYGILLTEVHTAVSIAGLDPFAGFLHVDRSGRPSLVLDLIEEFRQQVVDRVIVTLLSKGSFQVDDVVDPDGTLSKVIRQRIAQAVIDRLNERITFNDASMVLKGVIQRQAWQVSKVLKQEKKTYNPFYLKW